MDATIKAAWIAALRSGGYTQGFGRLGTRNLLNGTECHCVLGVLCELAVKANVGIIRESVPSEDPNQVNFKYNQNQVLAVGLAMQWAGLEDSYPSLVHQGARAYLFHLNDHSHLPFVELADLMEADLNF